MVTNFATGIVYGKAVAVQGDGVVGQALGQGPSIGQSHERIMRGHMPKPVERA